jgi:hypothetical protein
LSREGVFETALKANRRVNVELGFRQGRGGEERKSMDVIPVCVPNQKVDAPDSFLKKFLPKRACSGSAIQEDDRTSPTRSSTHDVLPRSDWFWDPASGSNLEFPRIVLASLRIVAASQLPVKQMLV